VFLVAGTLFPLLVVGFFVKFKSRLEAPTFKERTSSLYANLKTSENLSLFYTILFVGRRLIFALVCV